tara:strand:- start:123 stop:647 length:525 start_codon:yes stop_codon:yes gene_type:complete
MPKTPEYEDLRGRILNMWSGFHGPIYSSTEIGKEFNVSKNVVIGIVNRARHEGDLRAAYRGPPIKIKINRHVRYEPTLVSKARNARFDRLPPESISEQVVSVSSGIFCSDRNRKAKTLFNIGFHECHYPTDSVTNDGFRIYCGMDARDTLREKNKAYCAEHYKRMFYKKEKTVR